jgi:hypothetical protein
MRLTEGLMLDAMQGQLGEPTMYGDAWYARYAIGMHREVSIGIGGRENRGFSHLPPSFFLTKKQKSWRGDSVLCRAPESQDS